jgi:hypothetical protein
MALDEHAKLISPWYGPVTIFKDIGQNKYIIIDDNTNPEEMEIDGNIIASPAIGASNEANDGNIPTLQVINPRVAQSEAMDVEIPSKKHKRTHQGQVQYIQNTMPILSMQADQKPDWEW